jgi:hypothetical protein
MMYCEIDWIDPEKSEIRWTPTYREIDWIDPEKSEIRWTPN